MPNHDCNPHAFPGLEEASRLYFGESNVEGMLNTLLPLHEMLEKAGPTTLKEIAFVQSYGREVRGGGRRGEAGCCGPWAEFLGGGLDPLHMRGRVLGSTFPLPS